MTLDQAQKVVEYLEDNCMAYRPSVYEDYSGRGMYGRTVAAISVDYESEVAYIGYAFGALDFDPDDIPTRTDSMGRSIIIY